MTYEFGPKSIGGFTAYQIDGASCTKQEFEAAMEKCRSTQPPDYSDLEVKYQIVIDTWKMACKELAEALGITKPLEFGSIDDESTRNLPFVSQVWHDLLLKVEMMSGFLSKEEVNHE